MMIAQTHLDDMISVFLSGLYVPHKDLTLYTVKFCYAFHVPVLLLAS
jgi:hypothetical protein